MRQVDPLFATLAQKLLDLVAAIGEGRWGALEL